MSRRLRFQVKSKIAMMIAMAGFLAFGLMIRPSVALADPGFFGLQVQGLDDRAVKALGADYTGGVLVMDVAVGEAGAIAGFRRGDLIVQFDGDKVGTYDDLLKLVGKTKPDQKIGVVVLRLGKKTELTLHTTAKPASWTPTAGAFQNYPDLGMTVSVIGDDARKQFSLPWGLIGIVVTIVDEKSPIASGLHAGDVIVQANLRDLWEPRQLTRAMEDARKDGKSGLLLLIAGSGGFRYSILPLDK